MNNELYEVVNTYATKSHKEFSALLLDKSKDQLIALLSGLITIYLNDKNSSLLREYITVSLAGYQPRSEKIGYNGFKQSTQIGGKTIECEAKPQNINTDSTSKSRRLNGGGNFTDYTHKRFRKDVKANPNMIISGFVNGELLYVLEFPFKYDLFTSRLKSQLFRRFPGGDKPGEFLRSANFTFEHYKDCKTLKVIYLKKESIGEHKAIMTRKFYKFLTENLKHETKK